MRRVIDLNAPPGARGRPRAAGTGLNPARPAFLAAREAALKEVVDRTGAVTAYFRLQDGPDRVSDEPSIGRVDDICRRALGLPTPAPANRPRTPLPTPSLTPSA